MRYPNDVKNIFGSSITKQGSIEITGIGFKRGDDDNYMDVIVHADGNNKYKVYLDGEAGLINETQLAWIIAHHTPKNKPIRLLSCSDWDSAEALSRALHGRTIIASNAPVKVYQDGTFEGGAWRSFQASHDPVTKQVVVNKIDLSTEPPLNLPKNTTNKNVYVEMGSKQTLLKTYLNNNVEYQIFRDEEGSIFVKFDNGGTLPSGKPALKTLGRGKINENGEFSGQLTMKNAQNQYWHPDIRGNIVLKLLIDTEIENGKQFKVFKASWNQNLADNRDAFNAKILDGLSKGLPQDVAEVEAAKQTWTGNWLETNYKLDVMTENDISGIKNPDGITYSNAVVKFKIKP